MFICFTVFLLGILQAWPGGNIYTQSPGVLRISDSHM